MANIFSSDGLRLLFNEHMLIPNEHSFSVLHVGSCWTLPAGRTHTFREGIAERYAIQDFVPGPAEDGSTRPVLVSLLLVELFG